MSDIQKEPTIITAGGKIRCRRCQAMSKRSRLQCKKAAMQGKQVCRTHGGRSTGPRTPEGRQRIADSHTIHGEEARVIRQRRSAYSAYMMEIEDIAWTLQMMRGTRTRGRKPNGYVPIKTIQQAQAWIAADTLGLHHKVKF